MPNPDVLNLDIPTDGDRRKRPTSDPLTALLRQVESHAPTRAARWLLRLLREGDQAEAESLRQQQGDDGT
jgi:hypothetical protein